MRRWQVYFRFNKREASDSGRRGDFAQKVGRHVGAVVPDHGIDIGIEPGGAKKPGILEGGKDRALQMVLKVDPTLRPILEPEPQAEIPIQLNLGDPMHELSLLQGGDGGKRLLGLGQFPVFEQFVPMGGGPFRNHAHGPRG